jgi:hypothetical protein
MLQVGQRIHTKLRLVRALRFLVSEEAADGGEDLSVSGVAYGDGAEGRGGDQAGGSILAKNAG